MRSTANPTATPTYVPMIRPHDHRCLSLKHQKPVITAGIKQDKDV